MNGKRLLGLLLAVMMLLSLVTGCGKQVVVTEKHDDAQQTQAEQKEEPAEAAEEPAADHVKTGLSGLCRQERRCHRSKGRQRPE